MTHTVTAEAIENSSAKIFPKGTILIALYGATIGKLGVLEFDAATNQAVCAIFTSKFVQDSFLFFYLLSQRENIIKLGFGAAQPNISQQTIRDLPFPLPPLNEQKRIVEKLDTILPKVKNAKTRLENIPKILKKFRQSVLSAACSGKLTEEWREGKELSAINELEIIKRKRIEAFKLEKKNKIKKEQAFIDIYFESDSEVSGWAKAKLNNLIYISARIGWRGLKAEEYTKEGPLFLSVHSLNYGEEVNFEVAYHISDERYYESIEIALEENDILLCKDGAGIGKIGIVKNLKERATVNSSLLVIRALEAFHYKYLFYFLSGPNLQNIVRERMTGTAVPHLFQKDIKEFILSVPPIEEQHEIVRRVEKLFALANSLEEKYKTAVARVEKIEQSVLAKAFRGELVEPDPNDEPAEILLKRIMEEKKKTKPKPKKRA